MMFACLLVAAALSTTVAFAPSAARSSSAALQMADRSRSLPFLLKPAKLDGSMAGDEGFDPLGLSGIEDIGIDLYWMREAELKHSRVAMLAVVGSLMQESGFVVSAQHEAAHGRIAHCTSLPL